MIDLYPTPQSKRAREVLESRVRQGSAKGANARYLVQDILQFNLPIAARYKHLDVIRILQDNCSPSGPGLEALIHALSMLERYGKNLVRSERPPQWRVVRLSNSIFKKEVDILKGARDILRLLGYTKKVEDGLAYVDECVIPDIPSVASVTADILLLRQELTMLTKGEHKQQKDFLSYIPYEELSRLQGYYAQQQAEKNAPSEPHALQPNLTLESQSYPQKMPPSYEQTLNGAGLNPLPLVQGQATQQLFHPSGTGLPLPSTIQNRIPISAPEDQTMEVSEDELCHICGQSKSVVKCQICDQQYCAPCDHIWHNNPRRKSHKRVPVPLQNGITNLNLEGELNHGSVLNNHQEYLPSGSSFDQLSSSGVYPHLSGLTETRQPGEEQNQGSQPTVSGARLPPTPNSRSMSINDSENEWTRKVNRMATELMDIADPVAQQAKLFSCLEDINKERDKYVGGIKQLQIKGFEKPSLIAHFEEKLVMLENLKEQLKVVVGYTDPPVEDPPPVSSLPQNETNPRSSINLEESWSFKSVKSGSEFSSNVGVSGPINLGSGDFQHNVSLPYSPRETVPLTTAVHLDRPPAKPQQQNLDPSATIGNLIDFSTPLEAVVVAPSVTSMSSSYSQDLMGLDLQKTKPSKAMSSLQGLDDITCAKMPLGEVENASQLENFTRPVSSMAGSYSLPTSLQSPTTSLKNSSSPTSSTSSLKRLNSNKQNEENRPTKVYRANSSLNDISEVNSEITNRLENMNIETGNEETVPMVVGTRNDFQPFFEEPSAYLQNRIEEEPLSLSKSILQTLSPEDLQKRIRKEENLLQTTQFIDWIRLGQSEMFSPEHVQIAVTELDKEGNLARMLPNVWLRKKWKENLSTFTEYVKENCGCVITLSRAEECLLKENNNFPAALRLIQEGIDQKLHYSSGIYGQEAAQNALIKCDGDEYRSTCLLQKDEIKSFYVQIENENLEHENEDDEEHLRNILPIEDEELRAHAYMATFEVIRCIYMDTYHALMQTLPVDMRNLGPGDVIDAASNFPGDVENAIRYLDNECMICLEKFPRSKISCLPTCGDNECMYCMTCLEKHLSICITEKNIRDIVCPVCSNPEYNSDEETISNFFNHIDAVLRRMKDKKINELFQQKLRDLTLMRMPNFRWCSHCSGGFQFEIERENNLKMICPFCQKGTCYLCKKQWELQHEGISCEQFQLWKESNDPEFQAAGLARHLKENGIDCPDCNFRYALAKGGCMHFKCTQCSHEFCSGCKSPFKHGRACNIFPSCQSKGLHAHHPRDCLFYLRDSDPEMLQKLLDKYKVQYNTEGQNNGKCQVLEQKETPTGMKDDVCGREAKRGQAGLCKLHYNEYLVNLVHVNALDPAEVFSIDQLKPCLMREDKPIPKKLDNETNENYAKRLLQEVKKLTLIRRQR